MRTGLIQWTKNILGLDLGYFTKNTAIVSTGQAIEAALSLLLVWTLSQFTSKETFGTYVLVISIISLASLTSLPGFTSSIAREVALNKAINLRKLALTSIRYSLIGSLIILFLGIIFLLWRGHVLVAQGLILSAFLFPLLYSFNNCVGGYLWGKKLLLQSTFFSLFTSLSVTICVSLLAMRQSDVRLLLAGFLIATIIPNLIVFWLLNRRIQSANTENKTIVEYGKFLTKINIVGAFSTQADQLVLGFLLSTQSVANYRVASALTNSVKNLEKSFGTTIFPKFLDFKEIDFQKTKTRKLGVLVLIGIIITAFCFVVQPTLIKFIFGQQFSGIIFQSQLMVLSLLFIPIEIYFTQYMNAFSKRNLLMITNTWIPAVKIALTLILFHFWGFTGVILSNLLSRLFNVVFYLVTVRF